MYLKTLEAHLQRASTEKHGLQIELETRMAQFRAEHHEKFRERETTWVQRL